MGLHGTLQGYLYFIYFTETRYILCNNYYLYLINCENVTALNVECV
jgi:hypothetical protein